MERPEKEDYYQYNPYKSDTGLAKYSRKQDEYIDHLQRLVSSDFLHRVSKCAGCMGNGRNLLSTPGVGEIIWEKCRKKHGC